MAPVARNGGRGRGGGIGRCHDGQEDQARHAVLRKLSLVRREIIALPGARSVYLAHGAPGHGGGGAFLDDGVLHSKSA